MKERIYICHTYYHVYISCLKELKIKKEKGGSGDLLLSRMSNDFGTLRERAKKSGLFAGVWDYDEKEEHFFPELSKYRKDRGNLLLNMICRILFTKKMGKLQEKYVPVDLKAYEDIYVFCDSDPIGYYLNYKKIQYHAVEDGLDCIRYYDTARYDNRGHFGLKAWLAARNLIFIQNGYAKYCIDMEVNDISVLPYPCPKYIEQKRADLTEGLLAGEKELLVFMFIEDIKSIKEKLETGHEKERVLVLSEPLCSLPVRTQIFEDIIREYGEIGEKETVVVIKPHPRDVLNYKELFPEHIVLDALFPMEILNYIEGLVFRRVVSVFTVPAAIKFAEEVIFLGEDFMDKYEAPEIHRQNEQIE